MTHRVPRTASALLLTLAAALAGPARNGSLPGASARADGESPAAGAPAASDPLRDAWTRMRAAQDAVRTAAAAKDQAKVKEASAAARQATEAFNTTFATADWDALDPVKDRDLLVQGLLSAASGDLQKGDGKKAVRALELFLAKLADTPQRASAERLLPSAYMKSGDLAKAVTLLERTAAGEDVPAKAGALVALADVRCAKGDVAGARDLWAKVAALPESGQKNDPVSRSKADAAMRTALVGNAAPEIDSKTWLGGEARPTSSLRGKVVLTDFWATWCPPCRGVMPSLDKLAAEHAEAGLVVLGVTRFYQNGFMPKSAADLQDGEQVMGMTEETFPAHLAEFRKRSAISYPFVTATAAEFEAYKVRGIPTLVLSDREGKVAFVKVGGGDETLLRLAIETQLRGPAK